MGVFSLVATGMVSFSVIVFSIPLRSIKKNTSVVSEFTFISRVKQNIGLFHLKVLGVVHVLTGPDHLSALATLSANVSSTQSFWYGVRWGIGHSIGLVVVGSLFIFLSSASEDNEDGRVVVPQQMEIFAECLVGMFMLLLGSYQMYTAFQNKSRDSLEMNDVSLSMIHSDSDEDRRNGERHQTLHVSKQGFELKPSLSSHSVASNSVISHHSVSDTTPIVRPSIKSDIDNIESSDQNKDANTQKSQSSSLSISNVFQHSHFDDGFHDDYQTQLPDFDDLDQRSDNVSGRKQFIAVCIGIIHGVAGPGGVLGVVPAVQLHDKFLSTVYLGTFCCCSTLTMGIYAACYGFISSMISGRNSNLSFRIEIFSAGLSIFVGALWLVLLAMGKLEDIFP